MAVKRKQPEEKKKEDEVFEDESSDDDTSSDEEETEVIHKLKKKVEAPKEKKKEKKEKTKKKEKKEEDGEPAVKKRKYTKKRLSNPYSLKNLANLAREKGLRVSPLSIRLALELSDPKKAIEEACEFAKIIGRKTLSEKHIRITQKYSITAKNDVK